MIVRELLMTTHEGSDMMEVYRRLAERGHEKEGAENVPKTPQVEPRRAWPERM